ncbi:hypothetical protein AB0F96_21830 [Streptomyces sp. NPDC023998]
MGQHQIVAGTGFIALAAGMVAMAAGELVSDWLIVGAGVAHHP